MTGETRPTIRVRPAAVVAADLECEECAKIGGSYHADLILVGAGVADTDVAVCRDCADSIYATFVADRDADFDEVMAVVRLLA